MRKCENPDCDNILPHDCRKEMKYCSVRCRVAMHRKSRKKTVSLNIGKIEPMTQEEREEIYQRIADEIEKAKDL